MAASLEPNLYQLTDSGLKISYSSSSFDGKPRFTYEKGRKTLNFTGDEIHVDDTEIGRLVTVTLAKTVDTGFTSFSVLIPQINLAKIGAKQAFRSIGVQTEHKLTIDTPATGPLETYKVTALRGSASRVLFAAGATGANA
jgi:hypothetical protein